MEIDETTLQKMSEAARRACERAYCPYSRFPVGAAVLTASGAIYAGCNVENASYGLTICAERNAVFQAVADGERHLLAVLIYTPTAEPTMPCGACRQVLNEFGPDLQVFWNGTGAGMIPLPLSQLLPRAFGPHNLDRE